MMLAAHKCRLHLKEEIDLHIGHISTSWRRHLASCQSNSDLRTSNMLYANQPKISNVNLNRR